MIRGLIGVIHVPPMPGDPRCGPADGGFAAVLQRALADAEALALGGADALLVENFGSAPFAPGALEPHQVATLALVAARCVERFALPVGVNCLRNDAASAIGIAAAAGASFVRVNVHTGAYVTDQGLIEGRAHETLRYRQRLAAGEVRILADVLVKHAQPLAPLDIGTAVRDCVQRGLADGIVVTGAATGAAVDHARLEQARRACGDHPLYVGSGVDAASAASLAQLVEGLIVGTALKHGGRVDAPVDVDRVRALAAAVRGHLRA